MIGRMYQVKKASRTGFIPLRHLNYHVREWGSPRLGQLPLFMVHGWMDVSASFQFVVDAMQQDRHIISPDWRGFGLTDPGEVDSFWYPDYLADLDALIDHFQPEGPIDLLGHSMGGTVVSMYAGARPERIRRLINLEGFGLATTKPSQAPGRYAKWLNEVKAARQGELNLRTYPNSEAVAQRLIKTNPRLSLDKALWLAQHWAKPNANGEWEILGHAAHKVINPYLFRVEEMLALFVLFSRAAAHGIGLPVILPPVIVQLGQRRKFLFEIRVAGFGAGRGTFQARSLILGQLFQQRILLQFFMDELRQFQGRHLQ